MRLVCIPNALLAVGLQSWSLTQIPLGEGPSICPKMSQHDLSSGHDLTSWILLGTLSPRLSLPFPLIRSLSPNK